MESTEVYTPKYRCFCFITGHFAHIFRHLFYILPQKRTNPTGFHTHQFAQKVISGWQNTGISAKFHSKTDTLPCQNF